MLNILIVWCLAYGWGATVQSRLEASSNDYLAFLHLAHVTLFLLVLGALLYSAIEK